MQNPIFWLISIADGVDTETALLSNVDLGASPAELDCNPESFRTHAMINHQGSPEMDLTNCYGSC